MSRVHREVSNTEIYPRMWWYDPSEDAYCRVSSVKENYETGEVHLVLESVGRKVVLSSNGYSQIVREGRLSSE